MFGTLDKLFGSTAAARSDAGGRLNLPLQRDAPSSGSGWVDVSIGSGGGIVVPVEIDGVSHFALVDTGASVSAVDATLAAKLKLARIAHQVVQSDHGRTGLDSVSIPAVRLEKSWLPIRNVLSLPLADLSETLGRPISMVLGQEAFGAGLLEIDIPQRRLALHDRSSIASLMTYTRLDLFKGPHGRRCVRVSLEGVNVPAVFDLGSSNPLMLSKTFASEQKMMAGRRLSSAATRTLSGVEISTSLRLRDVSVGSFDIADVPAEAFDQWTCDAVPANLGLPLFSDFRMIVDLTGGSLWLSRVVGSHTPFKVDRSGLGLAFHGDCLRVMHVALGGPAEAAGWLMSSDITTVNGKSVGDDYFESGLSEWRYGEAGTAVRLVTADGHTRDLVLADYF